MVTISMVSYPPESGKELGKRFMELDPMPDFVEMTGPYMFTEFIFAFPSYRYYRKSFTTADNLSNHHQPYKQQSDLSFNTKNPDNLLSRSYF